MVEVELDLCSVPIAQFGHFVDFADGSVVDHNLDRTERTRQRLFLTGNWIGPVESHLQLCHIHL